MKSIIIFCLLFVTILSEPVILLLKDQVDLDQFAKTHAHLHVDKRAELLVAQLRTKAQTSQAQVISHLKSHNINFRSYWSPNFISTNIDFKVLPLFLQEHIAMVIPNAKVKVDLEDVSSQTLKDDKTNSIDWNVKWIKADQLWLKNVTGSGIIVANSDTGCKWNHPALIKTYRGSSQHDNSVNHNYAWWDALHDHIDDPENVCGYNLTAPCDDYGHGSHVMGSFIGKTPQNRVFGVSPDAKWMACRNMDHGLGNLQTFLECFQFYLAPTDVEGKNPDPSKRPHVIANSYGCGSGTCKLELFIPAIKALKIAGVATIASAGNSGRCSNINNVPAMINETITVGSTDYETDRISRFSDKGPVTSDRSNRLKPDFTAPGARIYSAIHCCGDYRENSGTSMACPHIGASIALLWSGVPKLVRNIDETVRILKESTLKQESTDCKSPQKSPNYVYGYGTPNVLRAYEIAIAKFGK